jgi:2-iminobutanoate/2-iminopropanoate deaminase
LTLGKVLPHLSLSRSAGNLVFVSGQMAFGPDGAILKAGVREQTIACIDRIAVVLCAAGLTLQHVVKTTVWLARTEDFGSFNAAYAECFPGVPPTRSTVRADLMLEALVEIEAIASRVALEAQS